MTVAAERKCCCHIYFLKLKQLADGKICAFKSEFQSFLSSWNILGYRGQVADWSVGPRDWRFSGHSYC